MSQLTSVLLTEQVLCRFWGFGSGYNWGQDLWSIDSADRSDCTGDANNSDR